MVVRGDMYTTDLLRVYFMFFMVCHGLTVAMFFMFQACLSFVRSFLEQKNIKLLINDNKQLTKFEWKRTF